MQPKYDKIGVDYDRTRKADPYLFSRLLHHLQPKKNGLYLDIGCGTGNYTVELHKRGYKCIGVEPSAEMLEKAKLKNAEIDWQYGAAEQTGLTEGSIDGIIAQLTIHHWADINKAFSELGRVLKTGGRIVIFTSTPEQMKGYWLNHYFPKMMAVSTAQMPGLETISNALKSAGIEIVETEKYFIQPGLQDQFLGCGKYDPELYFRDEIRRGISSFAALSNRDEVEQGLSLLRSDIESGEIHSIMNSFENDLGDYLYIVGIARHCWPDPRFANPPF